MVFVISQETGQRWNNGDRQFSSNLFYHWYVVANESWTNGCLLSLFQRWQDKVETMFIELLFSNLWKKIFKDDSILVQQWYFVEN